MGKRRREKLTGMSGVVSKGSGPAPKTVYFLDYRIKKRIPAEVFGNENPEPTPEEKRFQSRKSGEKALKNKGFPGLRQIFLEKPGRIRGRPVRNWHGLCSIEAISTA